MSLVGKRVVVVGGSTGIGFAISELARELGATLVIASSNAGNVRAAVKLLPGSRGSTIDLRDEVSIASFFGELGAFDHLAITAGDWGGPMFVSIRDLDTARARELLAVRFWGALTAVKYGCRTIAPDGAITLTSGMVAHRPRKSTLMATVVGGGERSSTWPAALRWIWHPYK
jgi:NAD(P)-dependent dehydrogenase (short-subunit alcohol dehydrogenase family)